MEKTTNPFRSPLRYPGGKVCIFDFVSHLLYENEMIGINYAEPYAGGAGLALRLLMEEYVGELYLNDLDPFIYAFWKVLLDNPEQMCDWLDKVDVNIKTWEYYKDILRNYKTATTEDIAEATLFLNRTNISGVIKGGVIGGKAQNGKFKIDARFNKEQLIARIREIAKFSKRIHLNNNDGIDFIKLINKKKNDFFIYLDPPYYKKGSDLYLNAFHDSDHQALAQVIRTIDKRWMISYDNSSFIKELYDNNKRVIYQLSQCTSNRIGNELLVFDDRLKIDESLHFLNSAVIL